MPQFISHPLIKPDTIESRIYQEVLAARVLEMGNSLVVAPTALGKTVVAVLVAAHRLQENKGSKIIFLAPTKPLAVQHLKSFSNFMVPEFGKSAVLTGTTSAKERKKAWQENTFISATPQTVENDLIGGRLKLTDVSLVIFDEAHRAVGDYAYVFIAQRYISQCKNPLILALTASPGGEQQHIQDVCKNLFIKNVEIKSTEDADVKPYANPIEMEWVKVDLPPKFMEAKKHLEDYMREQLVFLKKLGYAQSINTRLLGKRQMLELQSKIRRDLSTKASSMPSLWVAVSRSAALLKVSHAHTLLETQSISAVDDYFTRMKKESSKAAKSILADDGVSKAIEIVRTLVEQGVQHPKLEALQKILLAQFKQNPESRVLVFNHYRDSISNLQKYLADFPEVRATRFIGQAAKGNNKGMTQKEQIALIQRFKDGEFNTLLCSSVAEEGLDIPAVDLVVFFEAVPSEIRSIQRRGRTGRFAKGRAIILLAKGTRDEAFHWAAQAKEKKMQSTLREMKSLGGNANAILPKQSTLVKFMDGAKDRVLIYADTREQACEVTRELSKNECIIKVKQLDVGDYILSDDIVVERKTVEDFLQSMIDGRLFQQIIRMNSNYKSPFIILEGNVNELYTLRNIHKNAIIGALTSIAVNYRIPILFTENAQETAQFLYVTAKREQLGKEKDIRLRTGRKGLTLAEQQQFIVESFPSVGPNMARALLKEFKSIKNIVNARSPEWQEVENMGPKKAKQIRKVLTAKWEEKK
ncbi:DEAD/DEAH box helicase [Candidatus Micrarchaeota archaeon]|nr:DEAD/DEAH box helicase [Candidatus Micrarchaeota archaeon]MBU1939443.1 DEAD/DEAH box helicase [Candidatus Micrarchaeota archaeon]